MQTAIAPVWTRISDTEYVTLTPRQGETRTLDGDWEPCTEYSVEYRLAKVDGVWTLDPKGIDDEPEPFPSLESAQAHVADLANHLDA
ncbi:hypothetical protein [Amycolatopsis kentuckyensis]|uniref:hypothetical protein n=1 Tax=Amycolatopsis kentuckyensis TaxID=218823 RepID=UPI0035620E45